VKFARQLAAVLLTVAVVIALGVAWAHSAEAGWLAGRDRGAGPVRIPPSQLAKVQALHAARARQHGGGPGLSLSNSGDLIRTAVVMALIMAVVVTLSAARRRHRRARRAHPA
jgi:hypothetical protein